MKADLPPERAGEAFYAIPALSDNPGAGHVG